MGTLFGLLTQWMGQKAQQNAERQQDTQAAAVAASRQAISNADSMAVQYSPEISTSSSQGSDITDINTAANAVSNNGLDNSSSNENKNTSALLDGDMTFEELIGEICGSIDLVFIVKRSIVVITDYESLYAEAKYLRDNYADRVKNEDLSLWQLADGSYELDIQDYGFYTTVEVNYNNGTIKESIEDLVRVFGEVKITYDEPEIDKTTAIMKAKAYLAAHMREFEVTVKADLLHDGDVEIGDIVTLENPQTLSNKIHNSRGEDSEFLFVTGSSVNWDSNGPIMNSIEMRFGPVSPEKKEVPEYGASYDNSNSSSTTGDVQSALDKVGQQWSKIGYCHSCQTGDCVKSAGCGDCWGASDLIACELQALGVNTRIVQYAAIANNHRSVLYQDKDGTWKDFPYRTYGFNTLFNNTSASTGGSDVGKTC